MFRKKKRRRRGMMMRRYVALIYQYIETLVKTRPNWARKVRELILFNVLCTVYCGRGCVSLESE